MYLRREESVPWLLTPAGKAALWVMPLHAQGAHVWVHNRFQQVFLCVRKPSATVTFPASQFTHLSVSPVHTLYHEREGTP